MHRSSPAQTPDQQQMGHQQQPTAPGMPGFQGTPGTNPQMGMMTGAQSAAAPPVRPPSPKFVSVDMPAAKISHSDVYMRYGLTYSILIPNILFFLQFLFISRTRAGSKDCCSLAISTTYNLSIFVDSVVSEFWLIYLRYISGLRGDNPIKVTNWERELIPDQIPPPDPSRVPGHWLVGGAGAHGTVLNALHSLRDLMMQDSLRLKKTYQLWEVELQNCDSYSTRYCKECNIKSFHYLVWNVLHAKLLVHCMDPPMFKRVSQLVSELLQGYVDSVSYMYNNNNAQTFNYEFFIKEFKLEHLELLGFIQFPLEYQPHNETVTRERRLYITNIIL